MKQKNIKRYKRVVDIFILLVLISILFQMPGGSPAPKVEAHASPGKFTGYLERRIPVLMKTYDIPGLNIALVKQGRLAWLRAYGYADVENKIKMTVDMPCRVESISKPVTAWGVMKLVEQGKLSLDTRVSSYLKSWRFPSSDYSPETITVRQLLSHTAGLPLGTIGVRYSPEEDIPTLKELLSHDAVLEREPGQSFNYSNTGFNLLELIVEEVSGQDFSEFMTNTVLMPLGMIHSSYNWQDAWQPGSPKGYDGRGNPIGLYIYPDKASGGLFAPVEDIARFVSAEMPHFSSRGKAVLSLQNIYRLYAPEVKIPGLYGQAFDSYGMGHFIEKLPGGVRVISHGGQGSGWMTHFSMIPETGDGIVMLTNSQRSWPFFAYLLNDWAEWCGFSQVGMGRIIQGQKALWIFIMMLVLFSLWQGGRLGYGIVAGQWRFAPLNRKNRYIRALSGVISIFLIVALIWVVNQDYFFLCAVFPIASVWLGYATALSSLVLLVSSLFVKVKVQTDGVDI